MLVVLLVVIAVLLATIIALLPRRVSPQEIVRAPDTGNVISVPDTTPSTSEVSTASPPPSDGGVTEYYPETETPPATAGRPDSAAPVESGSTSETNESPWWLPADAVAPSARGSLALVLDDAGNSIDGLDAFLSLPIPLAVAVLPQLDYSVESAAMIAAAGKEIMLHEPMEPVGGANPGPGAVGPELSDSQIESTTLDDLASVPGVIGVNNHMGSRATADERVMSVVLQTLKGRDLFFLDSRTSAESVARRVAAEVGLPFVERNVFLDNERTTDSILSSLSHALDLAQKGVPVVMIGHVTVPLVAEVLHEAIPIALKAGYRFVPVSSLAAPVSSTGSAP